MENLIIIGASGFGREVMWLIERINAITPKWNLLGFLDDNKEIQGNMINGVKVIGTTADSSNFDAYYICAIGASKIREKVIQRILGINPSVKFATLIDPSVEMSGFSSIGEGSIICAHTILTVNVEIGRHVIINLDCTIGHDAILHDFSTLYPSVNISGNVEVGYGVELGTGTHVIQGKTIGEKNIIGAGSVVIRDITTEGTYVGVPTRIVRPAPKFVDLPVKG